MGVDGVILNDVQPAACIVKVEARRKRHGASMMGVAVYIEVWAQVPVLPEGGQKKIVKIIGTDVNPFEIGRRFFHVASLPNERVPARVEWTLLLLWIHSIAHKNADIIIVMFLASDGFINKTRLLSIEMFLFRF